MNKGRIIARHGQNLWLRDAEDHQLYFCWRRKNLPELVCGDWVHWQPTAEGQGVINELLPRKNLLNRRAINGKNKPLAANIDQLLVVLAKQPPPTGYLLDQYLMAAELLPALAAIVLNKMDLGRDWIDGYDYYRRLDYAVLPVSAHTGEGLAELQKQLKDQTNILVGQSGVGKSSLINALLPQAVEEVGELAQRGLGKHTTSVARLHQLPQGGSLIDSPGVRSFRLGCLDAEQVIRGFKEIAAWGKACRFSDCRHLQEPGCAVKQAVAEGLIADHRWQNYQLILDCSDR